MSDDEIRRKAICSGANHPARPCNTPVHPGYTICYQCKRPYSREQIEAALKLPENKGFLPSET